MLQQDRTGLFISYSHQDKEWLDRLRVHLRPLERDGQFECWDDTRIRYGGDWRNEVQRALGRAKVAILIVSADFLASDFIANDELPLLLAAAKDEGVVVIPLVVSPCRFSQHQSLSALQAPNSPQKPLTAMTKNEQEEVFVRVVTATEEALRSHLSKAHETPYSGPVGPTGGSSLNQKHGTTGSTWRNRGIAAIKDVISSWSLEKQQAVRVDLAGVQAALDYHRDFSESWSRQISLRDLPRSRSLSDVYIRLKLADRVTHSDDIAIEADYLLTSRFHSILLGHPGSGKTTTVKYLCQKLLHQEANSENTYSSPLLVLLRDIKPSQGLNDHLLQLLNIQIHFPPRKQDQGNRDDSQFTDEQREMEKTRILIAYLKATKLLVLLDGLDEVPPQAAETVRQDIRRLALPLEGSKFVLTCRHGTFEIAVDNSETLHVCPLEPDQVLTLATRWLQSTSLSASFLEAVSKSPYRDTIGRPLVLVSLCMVFHAYGELPNPPSLIYQKVVQLLLEQWDRERDLRRASKYGRFGPDRKRQFLAAMAYALIAKNRTAAKYTDSQLREAYEAIHANFALPLEERDAVLAEVESHTGLIVSAGFRQYEFAHKSIQEYLCADYISRLPDLRAEMDSLRHLPNECAITTTLSSTPNKVFELFVFENALATRWSEFWSPYLTRLTVEMVSFTQEVGVGLALLCLDSLALDNSSFVRVELELMSVSGLKASVRKALELYVVSPVRDRDATVRLQARGQRGASVPERLRFLLVNKEIVTAARLS